MRYGISVKNRFTGKIYEEHDFISLNAVYKVQDAYMFQPWVKMTVWQYGGGNRMTRKVMSLETETNENVHNSDHLISVYNEAYDTFYKQSGQMNSDRAHEFALAAVFINISEKETDE